MTDHLDHPCTVPAHLLANCRVCTTRYIRKDHGPQSLGYCSESCLYHDQAPPIEPPTTDSERRAIADSGEEDSRGLV